MPDPKVGGSNPLRHASFSPQMAVEFIDIDEILARIHLNCACQIGFDKYINLT